MNTTGTEKSLNREEVWRKRKIAQKNLRGFEPADNIEEDRGFVEKFSRSRQDTGSGSIAERIAARNIRPGDRVLADLRPPIHGCEYVTGPADLHPQSRPALYFTLN